MGGEWGVWKFVLLQRLPHTGKYVGLVIYVEPQNTAIFSDCRYEVERRRVGVFSRP